MRNGEQCAIKFNRRVQQSSPARKASKEYFELFPKVADAGFEKVICFSGNRNGISDEQGIENCAVGLEPVVKKLQNTD